MRNLKRLTNGTSVEKTQKGLLHKQKQKLENKSSPTNNAYVNHFEKSEAGCVIPPRYLQIKSVIQQQGAFKIKISISIRPISRFEAEVLWKCSYDIIYFILLQWITWKL